ncbi:ATP binding domain 4-like protein [Phycomyces blakesleeanus]
MMQCVANGHSIVALANLKPPVASGKDELDSFMYQTVGHDAIHFYSDCMNLPLYRREINGQSVLQKSDYVVTANDETEDLYLLLKDVLKEHPDVQGVSVGAILSNYQRVRVEHVCNRLGLTSLAYLWRRDQRELLAEMAAANVNAVLIKVAAMGLKAAHLEKSIAQMYPILCNLNEKYDLHVCGEGGEYETFTLDCPLFKKRIVIEERETIVHSDDAFAPVAYLRFKRCILVDKTPEEMVGMDTIKKIYWKEWESYESLVSVMKSKDQSQLPRSPIKVGLVGQYTEKHDESYISCQRGPLCAIASITAYDDGTPEELQQGAFESIEDETFQCMLTVQDKLMNYDLSWDDVVCMNVFVADIADFGKINAVYKQFFDINPAPRALVGAKLKGLAKLKIDLVACKKPKDAKKSTMHVQGISYWAPANIGPYSQTVTVVDHVWVAGQIGLVPETLELPSPPSFVEEAALSLRNLETVIKALDMVLKDNISLCYCFVTRPEHIQIAQTAWNEYVEDGVSAPIMFLVVPALPKGGLVEWQVMLHVTLPINKGDSSDEEEQEALRKLASLSLSHAPFEYTSSDSDASIDIQAYSQNKTTTVVATASVFDTKQSLYSLELLVKKLVFDLNKTLIRCEKDWSDVLFVKLFCYQDLDVSKDDVRKVFEKELATITIETPAISEVPVVSIGPQGTGLIGVSLHALKQ